MKAVIFTQYRDLQCALRACQAVKKLGVEPVLALDFWEPYFHCDIAQVVTTDFPRKGNLNGTVCVLGMLDVISNVVSPGDEWVLKLDADTVVKDLKWLEGRSKNAVMVGCEVDENYGIIGCCYALRCSALAGLMRVIESLPVSEGRGEDALMSNAAKRLGGYDPYPWSKHGSPWGAWDWKQGKGAVAYYQNRSVIEVSRRNGDPLLIPGNMDELLKL